MSRAVRSLVEYFFCYLRRFFRPHRGAPMTIRLFEIPGDQNNALALAYLEGIEGAMISEVICPPSLNEFCLMPFIRVEGTGRFSGLDEIQYFASRKLAGEHKS